jgi:hypothetical protein
MDLCKANPRLVRQILFSNDATICVNGTVNRKNCSRENPHGITDAHTQQKVNVWAGIVNNNIIGPFFFEETLTGDRYLEFLQNDLRPALVENFPNVTDHTLVARRCTHFVISVRHYLNNWFPRR